LFLSLIPHAAKDEERRLTCCFEDSKQCTHSDQAYEVLAKGMASEDNALCHDVKTEVFCDRNFLENPVGRILHNKDSEVDTGCEP